MYIEGSYTMVGNLSRDGVTIKTLVGGNLKKQKLNIVKSRSQKTGCLGRHADKSGQRLLVKSGPRTRLLLKNMLLVQTPPLNI